MITEYKSMEFQVRRHPDGKWEWTIPKLNIGGQAPLTQPAREMWEYESRK